MPNIVRPGAYPVRVTTVIDQSSVGTPLDVRPQTLLLTLLGSTALDRDVAIFSGSFVTVMGRLGISEHATRSTLARMVARGLLVKHRRGRRVYLGLTPRAAAVLREGEERMWRLGAVNRDTGDRWTLLGFSLPESRRDERHLLRSRLRWAGFGMLRSGLWIAPGTVDVTPLVSDPQLHDHVLAFRAVPVEPVDVDRMVRDAYDLPAIAVRYQDFLRRWDTRQPLPDATDDLTRHLLLLSDWLLLLRDDPRIPLHNLSPDWPAVPAQEVFHRTHDRLQPSARRVVEREIDSVEVAVAPREHRPPTGEP